MKISTALVTLGFAGLATLAIKKLFEGPPQRDYTKEPEIIPHEKPYWELNAERRSKEIENCVHQHRKG